MNTCKYRARVLGTRREKQWVRRVGDTFYKGENLYGKIDAAWGRERESYRAKKSYAERLPIKADRVLLNETKPFSSDLCSRYWKLHQSRFPF